MRIVSPVLLPTKSAGVNSVLETVVVATVISGCCKIEDGVTYWNRLSNIVLEAGG